MSVRLFARLKELVGQSDLARTVASPATVADVWADLIAEYPAAAAYASSVSCAVNAEYARMTSRVEDGDEVAFLPPVSGG